MKVMVVLDPDYGAQADPPMGDAFWLVESPDNRALAQRVWAAGAANPNSAVFRVEKGSSAADVALAKFDTVDLHHPDWTEIEIVGVTLTLEVR